jgi:hypothetical protein
MAILPHGGFLQQLPSTGEKDSASSLKEVHDVPYEFNKQLYYTCCGNVL